jgi:hypothetical protein
MQMLGDLPGEAMIVRHPEDHALLARHQAHATDLLILALRGTRNTTQNHPDPGIESTVP